MPAELPFHHAYVDWQNAEVNKSLTRWRQCVENATPPPPYLPPGITTQQWSSILEDFAGVVGPQHVITGDDLNMHFSDPFAFESNEEHGTRASAALQPKTTAEIQGILKIANKFKIPLWTVSRGRNLGYGGASPRVKGSVIIELERMNRVLEVNDKHCYYTVEPGVSFYQLYEYIRDNNKKIWPSVPALGWGSVVGNALERGWGYTPTGDHSNHISGIEVVLPDGTLLRTGMGAIADSPCWPLFRGGYGPAYDSIFNQSNFGIVTKLTLWATPSPEGFMACKVDVPNEDDLAPLVDTLARLLMVGAIQNHPVIGNIPRALSMLGPRKKFYDGPGAIPDERLLELRDELKRGFWDASFALYGPKEIIDIHYRRCQDEIGRIPGAKISGKGFYPPAGESALDPATIDSPEARTQIGVPSMGAIASLQYRGEDGGHIGFSPVLPPDGKRALEFYKIAKLACARWGFDFYAGLHLYTRHLTHINMLLFDRQSPEQKHNINRLFVELVHLARESGYSEYRAHVGHMDLVAAQYDFNNGAQMKLNERIKDTLDPNGILSPGKQGIWPERFRGQLQPEDTDFTGEKQKTVESKL